MPIPIGDIRGEVMMARAMRVHRSHRRCPITPSDETTRRRALLPVAGHRGVRPNASEPGRSPTRFGLLVRPPCAPRADDVAARAYPDERAGVDDRQMVDLFLQHLLQ